MPFAEDQDMIQAVAPKCPDQALDIWVQPWRSLRLRLHDCAGMSASSLTAVLGAGSCTWRPSTRSISNPSFSSSPRMRGAPHRGFSLLIRRMRSRSSRWILGDWGLLGGVWQRGLTCVPLSDLLGIE
jgi:hypothetical protein